MASKRDRQLEEELLRLRVLIEQQNGGGSEAKSSRRNVMKLAGAALIGAAGTAALRAVPAAAASGQYAYLGQTNSANAETLFQADSASASPFAVVGASVTSANDGGTSPALVGFGGTAPAGIFAANTAPDMQAGGPIGFKGATVGTGRIAQIMRSDIGGSSGAPNWTPVAGVAELTQGTDASVWVTRSSGTGRAAWKRMNTMRFDATTGAGTPFAPVRVVDSRASQGPIGGQTGPFAASSTETWTIAGANGIPSSAIAVVGNLTAIAGGGTFASGGYLTVFPAGLSVPNVASLNYLAGMAYLSNFFICGLGTGANAGKLSVFVGGNAANIGIDIFAYVE